jgi:hypothetical protein
LLKVIEGHESQIRALLEIEFLRELYPVNAFHDGLVADGSAFGGEELG